MHDARLPRIIRIDRGRPATARAILERRWPFAVGYQSLPFQGHGQYLLREHLLNLHEEVFQVSQFGAPGRPVGSPETVGQVLGDTFDIGPDFFHLRGARLITCHPWLLFEVREKG